MHVRVSSLAHALDRAKNWASFVVSLTDHGTELPDFGPVMHMTVAMADVEVPTDMWAPQYDDVDAILVMAKPGDNILVHCEGGISRSTAMGIGLLLSAHHTVSEAVEIIHDQSPYMSPNKLILQHVDKRLNLGGHLVKDVQGILDSSPKDLQLWCDKCQVHFIDGQNCPGKHWQ